MCRSTVVKIFYPAAVTGALQARLVEASFCALPDPLEATESGELIRTCEGSTWRLRAEHMRRREMLVAGLEQIFSDIDANAITQVPHGAKPANES